MVGLLRELTGQCSVVLRQVTLSHAFLCHSGAKRLVLSYYTFLSEFINMARHYKSSLAICLSILLLVNSVSAGLLQSIREAAALVKETADASTAARDSRALQHEQPPSNQVGTEYFFFQKPSSASPACAIGDFVCLAEKNMKSNVRNEMANTMIKSVAAVMTEMLNATISRSLGVLTTARNSDDPQAAVAAEQAMTQVTGALQSVSSKVIQAFAYFVKVSISGVMWDLFHQVVNAAKVSPQAIAGSSSPPSPFQPNTPVSLQGNKYFEYSTGVNSNNQDLSSINPSSLVDNNSLKRAAVMY